MNLASMAFQGSGGLRCDINHIRLTMSAPRPSRPKLSIFGAGTGREKTSSGAAICGSNSMCRFPAVRTSFQMSAGGRVFGVGGGLLRGAGAVGTLQVVQSRFLVWYSEQSPYVVLPKECKRRHSIVKTVVER